MSQPSRISIDIPDSVISDCMKQAQAIAAALAPYLTTLTAQDRHDLPKFSDKTFGFMDKSNTYMETTPEFVPSFLDVAEFKRDFAVPAILKPLTGIMDQIAQNLSDTMMLAGSEALIAALMYYANVREAARRGLPNAKPVYEDLAQRYPGRGSKKDTSTAG